MRSSNSKRHYYPAMIFYRYDYVDETGISHIVITHQDPPQFGTVNQYIIPTHFGALLRKLFHLGELWIHPELV